MPRAAASAIFIVRVRKGGVDDRTTLNGPAAIRASVHRSGVSRQN
jgi:hypothetical protein